MFIAATLFILLLASMVIFQEMGLSLQKRHELFVDVNAACAVIALGFIVVWTVFGVLRDQHPSFSLWPLIVVAIFFTLSGTRAHKVYKDRYGTAPASS